MDMDDFIESTFSSFETNINIWKKESELFINILKDFENNMNKKDILKPLLNNIIYDINFVENNKNKIKESIFQEDILELAENITSSAMLLECSSEECYLLEDGSKVFFPITKDDFFDSLYVESMIINFNKSNDSLIELNLTNSPDYFNGSYFMVNIDKDKNIKFKGMYE
ncbi:hypothetical protein SDC9_23994 [bioreactor metagenome]|uniref:DUF2262 domain-containing protein n=1 Tax=bioreactor metagenome TaxID=1076179 RepID=A0A644UGY0_9ZZZZ|nr:hypothetical protein [Methanobrevibacter sp.]MEA4957700.1 hypothetical protein [Methanobrevibacter sp.]